jgi:hypothetical protein
MIRPAAGWAVILLSTLAWTSAAHAQSYRVVAPALPHGLRIDDVNDSLRAVGLLTIGDRKVPVTWQGSDLRFLPSVPPGARQLRINNTGLIAGVRRIAGDDLRAVLFGATSRPMVIRRSRFRQLSRSRHPRRRDATTPRCGRAVRTVRVSRPPN